MFRHLTYLPRTAVLACSNELRPRFFFYTSEDHAVCCQRNSKESSGCVRTNPKPHLFITHQKTKQGAVRGTLNTSGCDGGTDNQHVFGRGSMCS